MCVCVYKVKAISSAYPHKKYKIVIVIVIVIVIAMLSQKENSPFAKSTLLMKIILPITSVGKDLENTLLQHARVNYECKCQAEGYVMRNSSRIINRSAGRIVDGYKVQFDTLFEFTTCNPVEGMILDCVVKNISTAGIHCHSRDHVPTPYIAHLAREHHAKNSFYNTIQIGDHIQVRVAGNRFELYDVCMSVVGELVTPAVTAHASHNVSYVLEDPHIKQTKKRKNYPDDTEQSEQSEESMEIPIEMTTP